jgi:hypothetical protein
MLDDGLEYERLLYCCVVRAKSCLGGCVQIKCVGCGGKSGVDGGHEYFCEGWGDGDATIVFRVRSISFSFVQGYNFGCSPRGWWCLVNSTGI